MRPLFITPPEEFFSPERIWRNTSRPERLPIDQRDLAAAKLTSADSPLRAFVSCGIEEWARISPRDLAASSRIDGSLSSRACSTMRTTRFCEPAVPRATTASARRRALRLFIPADKISHAWTVCDLAEAADFAGCASVEEGGDWTAGAWATAGEMVSKSVHRIAIVNFKRVDDCATAGRR